MTREEIEQLDDTEPYSFETDREEWWYNIGLKVGLETADQHPRKGLWDSEKVCEWLKENAWIYDIVQVHCVQTNIDDIIHDLHKAMED